MVTGAIVFAVVGGITTIFIGGKLEPYLHTKRLHPPERGHTKCPEISTWPNALAQMQFRMYPTLPNCSCIATIRTYGQKAAPQVRPVLPSSHTASGERD